MQQWLCNCRNLAILILKVFPPDQANEYLPVNKNRDINRIGDFE